MFGKDSKELKVREKQEVSSPAEQTMPGLVFTPSVDIFENEKALVLLADLPGVNAKALNIDLRDSVLTLEGEVEPFEGANEKDVLVEYEVGKYYRQFILSASVDQNKIEAKHDAGVLVIQLPKKEEVLQKAPKQIEIK